PSGGGAAWLHRHSARGTAARRLGRNPGSAQAANRPAGAIVLTFYLDLSPWQTAAAMRVSLATLRRRLAEAGQRYGPSCLQTPEYQPYRDRQRSPVSQASRVGRGPAVPARPSASTSPGSRLAKRARRTIPDPQHGLASAQRDLLAPCR